MNKLKRNIIATGTAVVLAAATLTGCEVTLTQADQAIIRMLTDELTDMQLDAKLNTAQQKNMVDYFRSKYIKGVEGRRENVSRKDRFLIAEINRIADSRINSIDVRQQADK